MRATYLYASTIFKRVSEQRHVVRRTTLLAAVLLLSFSSISSAQQSANLTGIIYSKLAGNDVQINLVTDGLVGDPGSFSTDNPARIALDFFGMKKQLAESKIDIDAGQVESVVAVETPDRTRIIINLVDTARYNVEQSENGYAVTVYNTEFDNSEGVAPKPFAARPDIVSDTDITSIDFRRSAAGGGSLTVDMSDDGVTIDTRERDGEIIVDILGVNLPPELERRLDVVDFATPIQMVDAFQNADNVRLVIVPQGRYQHLSFQSGNRFNLIVDPIVETKEDLRNEDDLALGYEGERLSINFQKIDVRSALAVIADFTGINFVTSDSVQGEITINLKDVPWDQALEVIMRTKGLAKRQTGNVVWVAPATEIARVEEAELKANAIVEEFAPLASEIIQINYAKAKDIAEVIKSIKVVKQGSVSSNTSLNGSSSSALNVTETDKNSLLTPRGSVTVDERTNSLLVQDVAEKIVQLRNLVSKLDKPVRQVLIETRIVEASDTFSKELGVRLGFQRITANAQFPGSSGTDLGNFIGSGTLGGAATINDSLNDENPVTTFDTGQPGLAVDLGASGIGGNFPASYAFNIFKAGRGYEHLINLELSALEADGRGKIVASPRLITANQKEAVIKQGEERIFTVTGNDDVSVQTKEAVLALEVTPQITPDDRVVLDVRITQDSFIPLGAQSGANVAAALRKKEIVTQVLTNNGETIVIGGIYQEENQYGETKVPILGDLPFIGNLFKKKSQRDDRTELLIFLTPKIISPKLNLG
ncbi:MAG: type IV pilus secretin PilQ [Gammaproteobacteria bacterium]|nr:type IV pilus secretin PilQ [Gammaproteobacteria bacterium]